MTASDLLGVHVELAAEPAAHRRGDDPHLVLWRAGRGRDHELQDVGDLRGGPDGDLAALGLGDHGHAPGLHGRGDEALLDVALADVMGGLAERPLDGVRVRDELPDVGRVRGEVGVGQDGIGGRGLEVDDGGQGVVVDLHRAARIPGLVAALGHHHGDGVAREGGFADGDGQVLWSHHVLGHGPGAGQRAHAELDELGARVDRSHPRHGLGRTGVDGADPGVGTGAADDAQPEGAGDGEVVDVAGLAGQQLGVLLAEHPGTGDGHAGPPSAPAAAMTALTMLW